MAILTLKVVNLTYYNLKGGQFKVILTLKVVIFDLKVIKNGFGISDLISDFRISDFKIISDFGFGISDLPKYFSFYAILITCHPFKIPSHPIPSQIPFPSHIPNPKSHSKSHSKSHLNPVVVEGQQYHHS